MVCCTKSEPGSAGGPWTIQVGCSRTSPTPPIVAGQVRQRNSRTSDGLSARRSAHAQEIWCRTNCSRPLLTVSHGGSYVTTSLAQSAAKKPNLPVAAASVQSVRDAQTHPVTVVYHNRSALGGGGSPKPFCAGGASAITAYGRREAVLISPCCPD